MSFLHSDDVARLVIHSYMNQNYFVTLCTCSCTILEKLGYAIFTLPPRVTDSCTLYQFYFQLEIDIEPDKGWQTEDMFVPPGFHLGAEITGEDEKPEGQKGEQAFAYPMGIGGMIMNGCYGTNYQLGDPCYQAKDATTLCWVSKYGLLDVVILISVLFTSFVLPIGYQSLSGSSS